MMERDLTEFVRVLISRYTEDDLPGVLDRLDYPCGFYFGALVLPIASREQAQTFLSQTWADRRAAGIASQAGQLVAVGMGRHRHTPVWIEVTHADAQATPLLVHVMRLWVLPRPGGGFGVQMMELIDTAAAEERVAYLAAIAG
jgi:hypothetical protein